ncbi:hypothetical protein [Streptomyces sp. HB2AG]|uniref:hypothetical protein n=1 Tax=Streptomyces sp. HB2AG TaxID=2983400 RepID=UPI0022AAA4D0|nr:hypothetical protein [Streptomyces sp. HB2AG]MCZ2527769.1 hypothetical protein [Streptomyces sp. HB2AG]
MSDESERRTVEELITLYELHPEIKDIFVEGRSDRNFLESHLPEDTDEILVKIYAISDRVAIPDGELIAEGLLTGERSRVLWLAQQLSKRMPEHSSAAFVVDKDFASLEADTSTNVHGLQYTDYSSMEAYALSERPISKLLRVSLGAPPYITASSLISAIKPALVSLFLIRLCLRESGTGAKIPAKILAKWELDELLPQRLVEIFRTALHQLPVNERGSATAESLCAQYVEYKGKVEDDFRHFVNGHDVSRVIVRFLKLECSSVFNSESRRAFQDPAVLEVLLMSCVETVDLNSERLFRVLGDWVRSST